MAMESGRRSAGVWVSLTAIEYASMESVSYALKVCAPQSYEKSAANRATVFSDDESDGLSREI